MKTKNEKVQICQNAPRPLSLMGAETELNQENQEIKSCCSPINNLYKIYDFSRSVFQNTGEPVLVWKADNTDSDESRQRRTHQFLCI